MVTTNLSGVLSIKKLIFSLYYLQSRTDGTRVVVCGFASPFPCVAALPKRLKHDRTLAFDTAEVQVYFIPPFRGLSDTTINYVSVVRPPPESRQPTLLACATLAHARVAKRGVAK